VRLSCKIKNKPALIVGYAAGKKGAIHAVVIVEGSLKAVRLKHVELGPLPDDLRAKPEMHLVSREGEAA